MIIVADTSFLLSLYLNDAHTLLAETHVIQEARPLLVSPLARLEFTNGLQQWVFRKHLSELQALQLQSCFEKDHRDQKLITGKNLPKSCWDHSVSLSESFTKTLGTRSLDILHVSYAISHSATHFWSFDHKQRALASEVGLELNPLD